MTPEEIIAIKEKREFSDEVKNVLNSVYAGDISFYEAMEKLDVSEKDLEDILELFDWMPSPSRIQELCNKEIETLSHIEVDPVPRICRVPSSLISYAQLILSGNTIKQTLNLSTFDFLFSNISNYQDNIVLNYNQNKLDIAEFNYQVSY